MLEFKKFIEMFDAQHALQSHSPSKYRYAKSFDIGNWHYVVTASRDSVDDVHWTISFSAENSEDNSDPYGLNAMSKLSKDQSALAPPASKVFAGVGQFIDGFITEIQPESFDFAASKNDPSRVSLYNLLSKKLASKYGFRLNTSEANNEIVYNFTKSPA